MPNPVQASMFDKTDLPSVAPSQVPLASATLTLPTNRPERY